MNSKRQKIEEPLSDLLVKKSTIELIDLNDYCLFDIFKWLPLNEFCVISETCQRIQKVATKYFTRKYPEKVSGQVTITRKMGQIDTTPKENYVKAFSHCFENIEICDLDDDVEDNELVAFIQSHCNEHLKKVRFEYGYIHASFGHFLKNILENVETVEICFCFQGTNFYEDFLKHCKNLKCLVLKDHGRNPIDDTLFGKYLKLEHFECDYNGSLKVETLKSFLITNRTIKSSVWNFYDRDSNPIEYMKCVVENAINTEKAILTLHYQWFSGVITMCGFRLFKRLTFSNCEEETLNQLLKVTESSLEEFYYGKTSLRFLVPKVRSLPNLKVLECRLIDCAFGFKLNLSPKDFPKLEILRLSFYGPMPHDTIAQFVRFTVNLKEIALDLHLHELLDLDIAILNSERKRLPGACALTISSYQGRSKENINVDNADYDLVKLK